MSNKQDTDEADDIRDEYDFADMPGGVRGKYADAFAEDAVTVLLDADVARIFPDSRSVNEALRTLARLVRQQTSEQSAEDGTAPGRR